MPTIKQMMENWTAEAAMGITPDNGYCDDFSPEQEYKSETSGQPYTGPVIGVIRFDPTTGKQTFVSKSELLEETFQPIVHYNQLTQTQTILYHKRK